MENYSTDGFFDSPRRVAKYGMIAIVIVGIAIVLSYVIFQLAEEKRYQGQVLNMTWECVTLEQSFEVVHYEDEESRPPDAAFNIDSDLRYEKRPGFNSDMEPVLKDVLVRYYSYDLEEWVTKEAHSNSGEGKMPSPHYLDLQIDESETLRLKQVEPTLKMTVRLGDRTEELTVDQSSWYRFNVGDEVTVIYQLGKFKRLEWW